MTLPMIFALGITVFMIVLIMMDRLPFGVPPLIACLLMVVFNVVPIKTAFGGFANSTIVMLAAFMAVIAALQKTSLITNFKELIVKMADKGGFKAYVLIIVVVMLGSSIFGTGSTAYYVLVIGLLSTLVYNKKLPPSKVLMPAGIAANHPMLPFNVALQYGIVMAVLQATGITERVDLVRFSIVNLILSLAFLAWCLFAYRKLPDHPIADTSAEGVVGGASAPANADGIAPDNAGEVAAGGVATGLVPEGNLLVVPMVVPMVVPTMSKRKELITYISFAIAVIGMIGYSYIGDAGYAVTGLAVAILLVANVLNFTEIRDAISQPIILMSAGVIGIADALGATGLTKLVGETVAGMLGTNISPFVLVFAFCVLTSLLATLTGSTLGTVYVFAPLAIATCIQLGLNPAAAAVAIVISGWNGHFLPIDGLPAMVMGAGKYTLIEFWKFTVPMYFIRLLALSAGALLMFPM